MRLLTTEGITGNHLRDAINAIKRLEAMRVLGFPVRLRFAGLIKLAKSPPIGHRILEKCVECLQATDEKKQWWPLMDLLAPHRWVACQIFPDHPEHKPDYLPSWLEGEPIEGGQP